MSGSRVLSGSLAALVSLIDGGPAVARTDGEALARARTVGQADDRRRDVPTAPAWIATLSTGILMRDGDRASPFVVGGISRKIGRGYVRAAATGFRSVVRQVDAALPSRYAIASIGGGAALGRWFVDGSVSAGRQRYGGVTTSLGTRPSQIGTGSGVYGAALSGGRFINLTRRLFLTPGAAVQYSTNKVLRSVPGAMSPSDYETRERAWTGSVTVRLDRFVGRDGEHLVGVSIGRVQTSNGAVASSSGPDPGAPFGTGGRLADGWSVAGASASIRLAPRLWLDGAATRTLGARTGDYAVLSIGARLGF